MSTTETTQHTPETDSDRLANLKKALGFKADADIAVVLKDAEYLRPALIKARNKIQNLEGELIFQLMIAPENGWLFKIQQWLRDVRERNKDLERERDQSRAIAAELLEALRDMVSDHADLSDGTLAFARATIAKATGKEPS